ncbi:DNA repair protein RecN [Mechercharimyces sp. CAU 1602]|uniref:DNA repair protein RecN n=1 Tax=Mechercharimyces sp. CAU 1602 TaxID=2973933 RepID=UPI00216268C4|nr:DNA repair protein RecN [Mechercharimyces sp. CAU 1602]MCS1350795.1 DNA repair protein RecN [Mechercharimyces sp. CAU 1602]
MLVELSIRDFAIIEQLHMTFDQGFHALTGETGAGKSILIDALSLVAGGRGSQEFIRHGSKKLEIEALFSIDANHRVNPLLEQEGMGSEDEWLVIRREITSQGKSLARVNGRVVTLAFLRELGAMLLDIHGQHEHQSFMNVESHLGWLDAYGGSKHIADVKAYRTRFAEYYQLRQAQQALLQNEKEVAQRLDLLRFQHEEISAAQLQCGEEEELEAEERRLSHAERLMNESSQAFLHLHGDQQGLEQIYTAMTHLEEMVTYDESLTPLLEAMNSTYYQLEEAARELGRYRDQIEYDPDRLEQIGERLHTITGLKRKYGPEVEDVLAHGEKVEAELYQLTHRDQQNEELEQKLALLRPLLEEDASKLRLQRSKLAREIEDRMEKELADLNMARTQFSVKMTSTPELTESGYDRVEYYISPNPGEPLKPLVKVASGGELSRLMLAIKSLFAHTGTMNTLIFDEIDTGVSGRAAQSIAEKMSALGKEQQVLSISHLPQVACMADTHFYIYKQVEQERTVTRVRKLVGEERIHELARMLGGVEVTDTTRQHAQEMLRLAHKNKAALL